MTVTTSTEELLASIFVGEDEAAALARRTRWDQTPLGPPEQWSAELCAAVRTVMPSRIPMLLWWGDDLVQVYNEAYRPLLGTKDPAAMGQPAAACWAEVWDELGPMTERVLRHGESTYAHELLLLLDRHGFEEETYWTFSYSPVRSADGTVLGLFVATTDVTEERVDAYRLDSVRTLAALGGTEHLGAVEVARQVTGILAGNPRAVPFAAVYLPCSAGGLVQVARYGVAEDSAALPRVLARDADHPVAEAARSRRQRRLHSTPEALGTAPGTLGPVPPTRATLVPLGAVGSAAEGVLVLGHNPYRRLDDTSTTTFVSLVARQLEALLAGVRARVEERDRAEALTRLDASKSAFFANVSHEFRTPLTVVLAAVAELQRTTGADDQEVHVDAIRRAASRLNRLVGSLLDIARAEAGVLEADARPVALADLTADVVGMFRSTVESAGLALEADVADVGVVSVDPEAWTKVVANLLSNAYKFTSEGVVRLRLAREESDVVLEVSDTGTGVAREEVERVFERFHQGAGHPVRGVAGTGIGLALVQDLVAAHGGSVTLDSAPGAGTTVTVRVPRRSPSAAPVPTPMAVDLAPTVVGLIEEARGPSELAPWTAPDPAPGHPLVLLVEDHPDVRAYLTRLLTRDGWSVRAVADVADAMRTDVVPDLVLCDVMLPGASGLDLVQVLRSQPQWTPVPIVLLTARHGPAEVAEGLSAGADDYVSKPFEAVELLARLRTHLELARERTAGLAVERERADNLAVALETNRMIGVAVGILMAAHRVGSDQAFALLRKQSMDTNRRLRDVADDVVLMGELPVPEAAIPRRDP